MYFLLALLLIPLASSENCTHYYDGHYFTKTAILTIKGLPTNLVVNPNTKDVLFTLIDLETLHNDHVQTKMDQYVLHEGNPIKIENVQGQAAAVDAKTNKVYIATDDGLAVLDENHNAQFLTLKDEDIVQIFKPNHKNVLYVSVFPDNDVYEIDLEKKEKRKIKDVPCAYFLAVDSEDNIYYECTSKYVKVLLKGFQEPVEFVGLGKNAGRAVALDGDRVILAANNGLYHLKPNSMIPTKLMDLDETPAGLAFDEDDFYVSTNGVIYKYSMEGCEGNSGDVTIVMT